MIAVIRSDLYRLATTRSSALSLSAVSVCGVMLSVVGADFWALLAGVGAFGFGATGVSQHYQHRTALLLFLARPQRVSVLAGQLVTALVVSLGFTAVSGLIVPILWNWKWYLVTLMVAPLMAVFGAAMATIARRGTFLFVGCTAWIVFVEAMYGKLQEPLPFSAYVDAASGNMNKLLLLLGWALAAIAGAVVAVRRDLNGD
jgi:ABC-2 type transport system ATP-binding protein